MSNEHVNEAFQEALAAMHNNSKNMSETTIQDKLITCPKCGCEIDEMSSSCSGCLTLSISPSTTKPELLDAFAALAKQVQINTQNPATSDGHFVKCAPDCHEKHPNWPNHP